MATGVGDLLTQARADKAASPVMPTRRLLLTRRASPSCATLLRSILPTRKAARLGDGSRRASALAKIAQADSTAAMAAYEEGLAIMRRLAETDKGNTFWQEDISCVSGGRLAM